MSGVVVRYPLSYSGAYYAKFRRRPLARKSGEGRQPGPERIPSSPVP